MPLVRVVFGQARPRVLNLPPPRTQPHKFNPLYPAASQLRHDMFWTTVSTLISSAWEVALLHLWARGTLPLKVIPGDRWWADPWTLAGILLLPHLQVRAWFQGRAIVFQ